MAGHHSLIASLALAALATQWLPVAAAQAQRPSIDSTVVPLARPVVQPRVSVTKHAVRIGGERVRYTATAGETLLYDEAGNPHALMFSTTYTRDDAPGGADRPVIFFFNGGPGAASTGLHVSMFGPRRLQRDGEERAFTDNPHSLLDVADLVFVDPVGTGYSRLLHGTGGERYWSIRGDAESVMRFVREWTARNGRDRSPKYLCGESYGAMRAATMLDARGNFEFDGAILISAALSRLSTEVFAENDLPYVLSLPTQAAIAWYHRAIERGERPLEAHVEEAKRFAGGEYLAALFQGDRLPVAERTRIAQRMSRLVGLPATLILERGLRIDNDLFRRELLADRGLALGRFDARITGSLSTFEPGVTFLDDPSSPGQRNRRGRGARIDDYFRSELGFESIEPYRGFSFDVNLQWKWEMGSSVRPQLSAGPHLAAALRNNPRFRLYVASSYFDLATPFWATEYVLAQSGVPRERITLGHFPAGHMLGTHEPSLARIAADLRAFVGLASGT